MMDQPFSADRPRELYRELKRLVARRAPAERELDERRVAQRKQAEAQYQAERQARARRHQEEAEALASACEKARAERRERFDDELGALEEKYAQARKQAVDRYEAEVDEARRKFQEARWEATAVFEATKDAPAKRLEEVKKALGAKRRRLEALSREAIETLQRRRQWRQFPDAAPLPDDVEPGNHLEERLEERLDELLDELLDRAERETVALEHLAATRWFEGARPAGLWILIGLASILPCGFVLGWRPWAWLAITLALTTALWGGLATWLYRHARKTSGRCFLALRQTLLEADAAVGRALAAARTECQREAAAIHERFDTEFDQVGRRLTAAMEQAQETKRAALQRAEQTYPPRLEAIPEERQSQLEQLDADQARQREELATRQRAELVHLEEEHAGRLAAIESEHQQAWRAMAAEWREGLARFQEEADRLDAAREERFFDWTTASPADWRPPVDIPAVAPLGTFGVELNAIEDGLPETEDLRPARTAWTLPAWLPFPDRALVVEAGGQEREEAVKTLQAVMLRMLTAVPPGKARFTIVDPVGLGENFSAFMHLADYDESLVTSRIWTESGHIEQRLSDLTEHMENVLQVYLRNEFATIREYNDFAGEMAEPYRVLVVANFPTHFTEAAAQRLLSIAASGARCGVQVLLSVDSRMELPHHFRLADLESRAVKLSWRDGRFVCDDPEWETLPLALPRPPEASTFTEIVRAVGVTLKDAERVEVPFAHIAPEEDRIWTATSRRGIDVPLGRAGAKKLQHLALGRGTSQHVLVAGKTGSGKSTLLHALITNVALHYSPDEIELYLVDFKKGVEFKAYATFGLPHARVVAIESEREFGLSVLERLDQELKRRGDLFREQGVQDVAGYRQARPEQVMPRILLIVDEFQELFVEDDRTAQDAALLLDRLVRQGRAFGIHVLLGSQTLAGAYSLPRATLGQMAVRIALQCSEADAHLILSEENTAARLLGRPGEAIYNDANGLYEGNHPFQVVWLPGDERDAYLERVGRRSRAQGVSVPPPIVFEGNVPADPGKNPLLSELLEQSTWPKPAHDTRVWFGAPVAIKDPSCAVLSRHGGGNVLMVGQREEEALGMVAAGVVGLAAQVPPAGSKETTPEPTFYLFDGSRPDGPAAETWNRLAEAIPHALRRVATREAAETVAEVAEELARREESGAEDARPIYLILFNLSRFRDLRKSEDDFGLGGFGEDKPPSPSQQLATILRSGPPLGIHALVWCDSYNTVNRALDRQTLRDLEIRVLAQMNAADSSNLIDSPAASRLGVHRAILYDDATGLFEKFRPYGLPTDGWLDWVGKRFRDRRIGEAGKTD